MDKPASLLIGGVSTDHLLTPRVFRFCIVKRGMILPWKVGVSQTPLAKAMQRVCHVVIKKQSPFFAKVYHAHRK